MEYSSKKIISFIAFLVFCIVAVSFLIVSKKTPVPQSVPQKVEQVVATSTHSLVGKSVQGREIESYTYGHGKTRILFVGGVHGGYELNSVVVAYKLLDYLEANPVVIPESISITVIPDLNPDGVFKVTKKEGRFDSINIPTGGATVTGRFNANDVDLNRNFDCKWQTKSTWQNKTVSAGSKAFSEPEAQVLRDFVLAQRPKAVIFWHSQGGHVYASQCENGILPLTLEVMNTYSKASGYTAQSVYDAYITTGDADSWLAKIGVPAVTVELKTHDSVEWEQNLAGVKSVIQYFKDENSQKNSQ